MPTHEISSSQFLGNNESLLWNEFVQSRSVASREELFFIHLPYARAIAAKLYANRFRDDVEFHDFYQLACIGLLESVDRFDPNVGVQFRTFCTLRIEGNVLSGIARLTEVREQMALKKRIRVERIQSLGNGVSVSAHESLLELSEIAIGLAIGFMLEETGMYMNADDQAWQASTYETVVWRETKQQLLNIIDRLPQRERKIINYHYLQGLNFDQIGSLLNLTKGRISQIHKQALLLLRKQFATSEKINMVR